MMIQPGFQFHVVPKERTTSYGVTVEVEPLPYTKYVVCQNQTVQDVHSPERKIKWKLCILNDSYFYQVNNHFKRCTVYPIDTCMIPAPPGVSVTYDDDDIQLDTIPWSGTPPR